MANVVGAIKFGAKSLHAKFALVCWFGPIQVDAYGENDVGKHGNLAVIRIPDALRSFLATP